ncbi:unnamed protein product, partial [marine sediment metagenome]
MVKMGMAAYLSAWRKRIVSSGNPLARAVNTKSLPMASIMPERVSLLISATQP